MEEVANPGFRVGPHRESHEPRLLATKFLPDGVTPAQGFLAWNGTQGIGEHWNMLHNDVLGDCGPAATNHYDMAKAHNPHLAGDLGKPKFDGVVGTYYAYGVAMGEGPNADQGVDNKTWLGFLYTQGIIYGYGEVPLDSLDWFAQVSNGALVGLIIDGNECIADFQANPKIPWPAMPDASDGHDTLLIITNTDGSGSLVTWGGVQPFTPEFRAQITDAWIIYDKDDPSVDHSALQAALADVHGVEVSQAAQSAHRGLWARVEHIAEEIKEALMSDEKEEVPEVVEPEEVTPDIHLGEQQLTTFRQKFDTKLRTILGLVPELTPDGALAYLAKLADEVKAGL